MKENSLGLANISLMIKSSKVEPGTWINKMLLGLQ